MKKIISLLVGTALAMSSTAFAFAADTNSNADISVLSALNIMNGYEDGTLRLDNPVTRAEVTKMVVGALGQTTAAESTSGVTQYSDVPANHWASGYINVGSNTSGFINGMGDGTFAPEGNVTYAQLVKMLVTSLGYGGMALQEGGYPTGYLAVGDRIGVTKSVIANANDELTRGQVATLIENALDIPLLVNTVWSYSNPEYEIKDGKGENYQTLLTEYHNAYLVEGKIVATSKTSGVDIDEVKFEIAKADRFGDDDYYVRNDSRSAEDRTEIVKCAIANPEDYLFAYSTAIIQKNDDDEFVLIAIKDSTKSKTITVDAKAFDDEATAYKGDAASHIADFSQPLKYYSNADKTGKTTDYKLADGAKTSNTASLWVNGVELGSIDSSTDDVFDYIVNNDTGIITLIDAPQEGKSTTDGYYDYVLVEYYKSAVVDNVLSNGTIYFDTKEDGLPSSISLDSDKVENNDLQYTILLNGKEIEYKDIQTDDVISIAYDVTNNVKDSEFYDIIVTRGTVEGKITNEDSDNKTYKVNGTEYTYSDSLPDGIVTNAVGLEATLYVDAFGRIVKIEETASSKKYAIAENVYDKNGEDSPYVKIILPDGTVKDYITKNDEVAETVTNIVFNGNVKKNITDRVITYKVNSAGEIYNISSASSTKTANDTADYSNRNNKIGSVKLNSNTAILDASDYISSGKVADLEVVSKLIDDTEYTAYGYDKLSDNTYAFVIITDGIGGYSDDTQIAIVEKTSVIVDSDDDARDALTVLYEGAEKTFIVDEGDISKLNKGDVITFKLNSSDEISQIDVIAYMGISDGTKRIDYVDRNADITATGLNKWEDTEVFYGAITDKTSSTITLTPYYGTDKQSKDYDISSDTIVYVYDYSKSNNSALYVGTKADIVKSSIGKAFKDEDDNILWDDIYDDDSMKYSINYALVRADKDDIQEIFVIIAPDKD